MVKGLGFRDSRGDSQLNTAPVLNARWTVIPVKTNAERSKEGDEMRGRGRYVLRTWVCML